MLPSWKLMPRVPGDLAMRCNASFGWATCLVWGFASAALAAEPTGFDSARPIWPRGRTAEMNLLVGFRAMIDAVPGERVVLRVAASTLYRATINGPFVGHG